MRWQHIVELIEVGSEKTSTGGRKPIIISQKKVFADRASARQNEFYAAYQSGFEATYVFSVHSSEYNDERVLLHDDKYYTIIRSYEIGDFIELTTSKRHGVFEETRAT